MPSNFFKKRAMKKWLSSLAVAEQKVVDPHLADANYLAHTTPHNIKLFSNSYDNTTRQSGVFYQIQQAIQSAENYICISIWQISLIQNLGMSKSLGQLLIDAERRGVKIFILAWDGKLKKSVNELTKENINFLKEKNPKHFYYKKCTQGNSYLDKKFFSHHQKYVLTEKKGFICGMNLSSKVVDSIEHADVGGIMWHDAAVMIEGPVLADLLYEFIQAWKVQVSVNMLYNSNVAAIEFLTQSINQLKYFEPIPEAKQTSGSIQLLISNNRTTNAHSTERLTLFSNAGPSNEIHAAMIDAITHSRNYVFIATQYFIGCYEGHAESANLISLALIKRIQLAHQQGENFHVYFNVTALPGSGEARLVVNSISRKQWKTMCYLINKINEETNHQSKNYITFIELGRFHRSSNSYHQIYVHSKFLFTPDEIIIGSANLNERSLTKNREAESSMRIRGYVEVINQFLHKIILEYFGTQTYTHLVTNNFLDNLGSPEARAVLESYLESQLSWMRPNYHFLHNNYNKNISFSTFDAITEIAGCAMPWGLINKENLLRTEKPQRVPESSPSLLSLANRLGGGRYTR